MVLTVKLDPAWCYFATLLKQAKFKLREYVVFHRLYSLHYCRSMYLCWFARFVIAAYETYVMLHTHVTDVW